MRELNCTPNKAREMMSKAGIRTESDFGRKLQKIIEKANHPKEEISVNVTEREQAQMHLRFLLSRINNLPMEKLNLLFNNNHQQKVIQN